MENPRLIDLDKKNTITGECHRCRSKKKLEIFLVEDLDKKFSSFKCNDCLNY